MSQKSYDYSGPRNAREFDFSGDESFQPRNTEEEFDFSMGESLQPRNTEEEFDFSMGESFQPRNTEEEFDFSMGESLQPRNTEEEFDFSMGESLQPRNTEEEFDFSLQPRNTEEDFDFSMGESLQPRNAEEDFDFSGWTADESLQTIQPRKKEFDWQGEGVKWAKLIHDFSNIRSKNVTDSRVAQYNESLLKIFGAHISKESWLQSQVNVAIKNLSSFIAAVNVATSAVPAAAAEAKKYLASKTASLPEKQNAEPIYAEMKVVGKIKNIVKKGDKVMVDIQGELHGVSFPSVAWLNTNREKVKKSYATGQKKKSHRPPPLIQPQKSDSGLWRWIQFFLSTFGIQSIQLLLSMFGIGVSASVGVFVIPVTITLIMNAPRFKKMFQTKKGSTLAMIIGSEIAVQMTGILAGQYFNPNFIQFGSGSKFFNTVARIFVTNLTTGVLNRVKGSVWGIFNEEILVPAKNVPLKQEKKMQFGVEAWISQYTIVASALVAGVLCVSLRDMNLAPEILKIALNQVYNKAQVSIILGYVTQLGYQGGTELVKQKIFKSLRTVFDNCKKLLKTWISLNEVDRKYFAFVPRIIINILTSNIVKDLGSILSEVLTNTLIQLTYEQIRNLGLERELDIVEIELPPRVEGGSQLKYRSVGETFVSNGQIVQKTLGDILNMVSSGDLDFTTAAKVLQENWFPRVPLPISLPRPVLDEENQANIQKELEEAARIQRELEENQANIQKELEKKERKRKEEANIQKELELFLTQTKHKLDADKRERLVQYWKNLAEQAFEAGKRAEQKEEQIEEGQQRAKDAMPGANALTKQEFDAKEQERLTLRTQNLVAQAFEEGALQAANDAEDERIQREENERRRLSRPHIQGPIYRPDLAGLDELQTYHHYKEILDLPEDIAQNPRNPVHALKSVLDFLRSGIPKGARTSHEILLAPTLKAWGITLEKGQTIEDIPIDKQLDVLKAANNAINSDARKVIYGDVTFEIDREDQPNMSDMEWRYEKYLFDRTQGRTLNQRDRDEKYFELMKNKPVILENNFEINCKWGWWGCESLLDEATLLLPKYRDAGWTNKEQLGFHKWLKSLIPPSSYGGGEDVWYNPAYIWNEQLNIFREVYGDETGPQGPPTAADTLAAGEKPGKKPEPDVGEKPGKKPEPDVGGKTRCGARQDNKMEN